MEEVWKHYGKMATCKKEQMNIVIVGHVDHGKSTVIGRLLADTNSLPEGKLESIKVRCQRESKEFEYAFLLDALKDEQDQGITIDSARVFFNTEKRNYIIIDAPGHIEFLKNMISGAARAEAAFLVIGADEGIQENSKRHAYMLSLLGIKEISILVNKMDLINYDKNIFDDIKKEYTAFLENIALKPLCFVPISAREGDNISKTSSNMSWYSGKTTLEILDDFKKEKPLNDKPARMPLQGVYRFTDKGDSRRLFAGRVESGTFHKGDDIIFLPSNKISKIKSIEEFNAKEKSYVTTGYSTAFTLEEQVYVNRGELICKKDDLLAEVSSKIEVSIFWMGKTPLTKNKEYLFKLGTTDRLCKIVDIKKVLDASNLKQETREQVNRHEVADCIIEINKPIAFDLSKNIQATSRFVLVDDYTISGGGIITSKVYDNLSEIREKVLIREEKWVKGSIHKDQRSERFAQKPVCVLLTGKTGLDKISVAKEVEQELFRAGRNVYFLTIANLIRGIDADLDKSQKEEHLRRLFEMVNILIDAGQIVIATASDLEENDYELARTILGSDNIITIGLDQDLELKIDSTDTLETNKNKIISYLQEKNIIFTLK